MNHNGFVPNSQPMKIYLCEREKVILEVEIPEKVKGEEKVRGNEKKKKYEGGEMDLVCWRLACTRNVVFSGTLAVYSLAMCPVITILMYRAAN